MLYYMQQALRGNTTVQTQALIGNHFLQTKSFSEFILSFPIVKLSFFSLIKINRE